LIFNRDLKEENRNEYFLKNMKLHKERRIETMTAVNEPIECDWNHFRFILNICFSSQVNGRR
jgi:hypothetical protein